MARKPSAAIVTSHEVSPEQAPGIAKAVEAANQMAALQAGYDQGRDLVNQLLGQAQMANAFTMFSRTVSVSKLAVVKENKLYQQLAGMRTPNGSVLGGTWEDFCGLLGMSVDKADTDIANVKAFGEEALEQMQRIGIGYRDLRQFRKLPSDERIALIEAAKSGDKDELLDLAESLISKHTKEKEELEKAAAELKADYDAQGEVIRKKDEKLNEADKTIRKLQKHIDARTPDEFAIQLREEVTQHAFNTEASILGALTQGFEALDQHAQENGCTHEEFMSGCLFQIERSLISLRSRFNIKAKPDGDEVPEWLRPGADEAAAKALAEAKKQAGKQ